MNDRSLGIVEEGIAISPKVLAVVDSESYLKWASAMLGMLRLPQSRLVLLRTPLTVSPQRERAAIAGTGLPASRVERVDFRDLAFQLDRIGPDVVIVAGRGPFVRIVLQQIRGLRSRPIVVTGLPGMAIPAQSGSLRYRRGADLFVVHSRRERRAYRDLADQMDVGLRVGLAGLPAAQKKPADAESGRDLVFAAQAAVPRDHEQRLKVADILRRAAVADPSRRVVVKVHARPEVGEREQYSDDAPYPRLFAELGSLPRNIVFTDEPMAAVLEHAEGLVTISSTAAVDAIAHGIPVIALNTFGVSKDLVNTVFAGSGMLGAADDVIARRFRHPSASWSRDNYFHEETRNTWWSDVTELLAARREGTLAPTDPPLDGGWLRRAWDRQVVLGHLDRTISGRIARVLGPPARSAALRARHRRDARFRRVRADEGTDVTVADAIYPQPLGQR